MRHKATARIKTRSRLKSFYHADYASFVTINVTPKQQKHFAFVLHLKVFIWPEALRFYLPMLLSRLTIWLTTSTVDSMRVVTVSMRVSMMTVVLITSTIWISIGRKRFSMTMTFWSQASQTICAHSFGAGGAGQSSGDAVVSSFEFFSFEPPPAAKQKTTANKTNDWNASLNLKSHFISQLSLNPILIIEIYILTE